jgi:hypothetical protein
MGKRSNFEHKKLNHYPTPRSAVLPLLPHLAPGTRYCEPCAGEGVLMGHLDVGGHVCVSAFDVMPQRAGIRQHDASWITEADLNGANCVITNPPWDRAPLHQIIERCATLVPTWLLFDADWMHTAQAAPYLKICRKIVSVGRVKWIAESANTGKDNCCWYLFNANNTDPTIFVGKK